NLTNHLPPPASLTRAMPLESLRTPGVAITRRFEALRQTRSKRARIGFRFILVGFGGCVKTFGICDDLVRRQTHSSDDRDPAIGRRHGIRDAFALAASPQQSFLRIQHAPDAEGLSVRVVPGDEDSAAREACGVRMFSDLLARIEQSARSES